MDYRFAERMKLVKPSAIRELLKLGADPEVISFGGGFPDPDIFPIEQLRKVYDSVLVTMARRHCNTLRRRGCLPLGSSWRSA